MRIKPTRRQYLIAYTVLAGFLLFFFWPTDLSKTLELKLTKLSEQATMSEPLNPIGARLKALELLEILTDPVDVEYRSKEDEFIETVSKQEIINHLTFAIVKARDVKIGFSRFKLLSSTKNLASVSVFLIAEWREPPETELFRAAEDLRLQFKKIDNEWLIEKIEALPRITL